MDITYNKVDQTQLPINPSRVSASEYNQIAGSLMYIINASGLTPDSQNNEQLLNALKQAVVNFPYITETYHNGTSWYRVWSDGWCEQGQTEITTKGTPVTVVFLKTFSSIPYCKKMRYGVASITDNAAYSDFVTLTTTGFTSNQDGNSGKFGWYACGYID